MATPPRLPRVLVVSPKQTIQAVLARMIREMHAFEVFTSFPCQDALGVCNRESVDVVIADHQPGHGFNGMDLLLAFRKNCARARKLPLGIIAVVDRFGLGEAVTALTDNASDIIMRPYSNESVRRALLKVVEHSYSPL